MVARSLMLILMLMLMLLLILMQDMLDKHRTGTRYQVLVLCVLGVGGFFVHYDYGRNRMCWYQVRVVPVLALYGTRTRNRTRTRTRTRTVSLIIIHAQEY